MKMVAVREIKKNPTVLFSDTGYRAPTSDNRPKALDGMATEDVDEEMHRARRGEPS